MHSTDEDTGAEVSAKGKAADPRMGTRCLIANHLTVSTAREIVDPTHSLAAVLPTVRRGASTLLLGCDAAATDAAVTRLCRSMLQMSASTGQVVVVDLDATADVLKTQFGELDVAVLDRLILCTRRATAKATSLDAYVAASAVLRAALAPGLVVVRLRAAQTMSVNALAVTAGTFDMLARRRLAAIVVAASPPLSETEARLLLRHVRGVDAVVVSGKRNDISAVGRTRRGARIAWVEASGAESGCRAANGIAAAAKSAASIGPIPVRETIVAILTEAGANTELGPAEIAQHGKVAGTAVRAALQGLVSEGVVVRVGRGLYKLAVGKGQIA